MRVLIFANSIFSGIFIYEISIFSTKKCTFTSVNLDFLSETCVNQNQKGIKEYYRTNTFSPQTQTTFSTLFIEEKFKLNFTFFINFLQIFIFANR